MALHPKSYRAVVVLFSPSFANRGMLAQVSEFLWWERLWLPKNLSWTDLQDRDGLVYARPSHLYAVLPCAFALLLVRYLFER